MNDIDIHRLLKLQMFWYFLILILIVIMLMLQVLTYLDCERQLEHERMIWKNLHEMVNEVRKSGQ